MRVFLDLDGVIVDFAKGCIEWYNLDCTPEDWKEWLDIFKYYTGDESKFWEGLTDKFWLELEFTKEAKRILTLLRPMKPCILTSPAWTGAGGKQQWIRKKLPDFFKEDRYLIGPAKHYLAHENALLIDDADENVQRFREAGGHAILIPRPWNSLSDEDVLIHLKNSLDSIYYRRSELNAEYVLGKKQSITDKARIEGTLENL